MKLIHIENHIDLAELADVMRRERLDATMDILRLIKENQKRSVSPWDFDRLIEELCRRAAINPNMI